MERIFKKNNYKNNFRIAPHRKQWGFVWMASANRSTKVNFGMGIKMKTFIASVGTLCFFYTFFSSACVHTLLESELEKGKEQGASLILINMSPRALSETNI